jgi:TetR/AcrR family transcriptional regulator, transcriptional repressor of bet genes
MKRAEKKILTLETRRREFTIATLESIRKHGYINSTINTISEESGLSRGLISHYFKNKDDLLLFAFRYLTELLEKFHRHVVSSWGGDSHFDKLLASSMVPFLREQPYREVWLHFWSAARLKPEVSEVHRRLWGNYRSSIERRITVVVQERNLNLNIRNTALMYTQLIDGLWLGLILEEAYDDRTCRMILRDWLCDVFKEDPLKHSLDPPFDLAALQSYNTL